MISINDPGSVLLWRFLQTLTWPAECRSRNRDSSDREASSSLMSLNCSEPMWVGVVFKVRWVYSEMLSWIWFTVPISSKQPYHSSLISGIKHFLSESCCSLNIFSFWVHSLWTMGMFVWENLTINHAAVKVTYITFLPHYEALFSLFLNILSCYRLVLSEQNSRKCVKVGCVAGSNRTWSTWGITQQIEPVCTHAGGQTQLKLITE